MALGVDSNFEWLVLGWGWGKKFFPSCGAGRGWGKKNPSRAGMKISSFGPAPPHCHPYFNYHEVKSKKVNSAGKEKVWSSMRIVD